MTKARKTCAIFIMAAGLFFAFFSKEASAELSIDQAIFAAGFTCIGDVPVGVLFDNGEARCDPNGIENLFTNSVCTYENIMDQILSKLYCGMQSRLYEPLSALMTLFVAMVGAGFALGILSMTAKEVMLAIFKFGLVFYFATESQLTIGTLYYGLMYFIQETVVVVLAHVAPGITSLAGGGGLFEQMDDIIAEFARNAGASQDPNAPCTNGLVAMFMTFIASIPMLAIFGISMALQFLMVFFQMILGYFLAITGIMFLIALSPFFLSFALFRFTRSYFDQWVGMLLSFAVQIFIVVGFIGLVISLDLYEDLRELYELSRDYTVVQQAEGVRLPFREWCSVCTPTEFGAFGITCSDGEPLHPQSLLNNPDVVKIFSSRLFKILVLAYILHKAMIAVPGVAKAIGAARFAPAIAGTDVFMLSRSIEYPGLGAGAAAGGARTISGSLDRAGSMGESFRNMFNPLVSIRK